MATTIVGQTKNRAQWTLSCLTAWEEWCKKEEQKMTPWTFIEWDKTQNGMACLDYSEEHNYRLGLYVQAHRFITFARSAVSVGEKHINMAHYLNIDGEYQNVADLEGESLEAILESFTAAAKAKMLRVKLLGASWGQIRGRMSSAYRQAKKEYKKGAN